MGKGLLLLVSVVTIVGTSIFVRSITLKQPKNTVEKTDIRPFVKPTEPKLFAPPVLVGITDSTVSGEGVWWDSKGNTRVGKRIWFDEKKIEPGRHQVALVFQLRGPKVTFGITPIKGVRIAMLTPLGSGSEAEEYGIQPDAHGMLFILDLDKSVQSTDFSWRIGTAEWMNFQEITVVDTSTASAPAEGKIRWKSTKPSKFDMPNGDEEIEVGFRQIPSALERKVVIFDRFDREVRVKLQLNRGSAIWLLCEASTAPRSPYRAIVKVRARGIFPFRNLPVYPPRKAQNLRSSSSD